MRWRRRSAKRLSETNCKRSRRLKKISKLDAKGLYLNDVTRWLRACGALGWHPATRPARTQQSTPRGAPNSGATPPRQLDARRAEPVAGYVIWRVRPAP